MINRVTRSPERRAEAYPQLQTQSGVSGVRTSRKCPLSVPARTRTGTCRFEVQYSQASMRCYNGTAPSDALVVRLASGVVGAGVACPTNTRDAKRLQATRR